MNSIHLIEPYKTRSGVWAFDDANTGLVAEPFVGEVNDLIDLMTASIPKASHGFTLMFSGDKFPKHQLHLQWVAGNRRDRRGGGNTYLHMESKIEGWLCPALFHYFRYAPLHLYASALAISRPTIEAGKQRR